MNKLLITLFTLCFIGISFVYGEPIENDTAAVENTNAPRIFYIPMLSYTYSNLGDMQSHTILGGLTLLRFNPAEKDTLFSVSLIYSPYILTGIPADFPNLYHTAAVSVTQKINRHTITGIVTAITDKPLYGGLRTFIGMAGYSYDLVKGNHFSMNIGGRLAVMDIGLTLDNGTPWLVWPLPSISLSWKYEWITFGMIPGVWGTIAPNYPVSLIIKTGSNTYDAAVWYRYFKNGNPAAERLGIGIGIKRDSSNVLISDGGKYSIQYNALYGTVRVLRLFEITGGWAFNGKDGYEKINWETLFESDGYSDDSMYGGSIGGGFFISISIKMTL